jgi:hypothetical protein
MIGLPFLDQAVLEAIFRVASDPEPTLTAFQDPALRDFVEMLVGMAHYNVKYRQQQLSRLLPVVAEVIEELAGEPEQASMVLGLILAIKELYNMRPDTLKAVLRQVSAPG